MVGHPSVHLSVCHIDQQQQWQLVGLLLSASSWSYRSISVGGMVMRIATDVES